MRNIRKIVSAIIIISYLSSINTLAGQTVGLEGLPGLISTHNLAIPLRNGTFLSQMDQDKFLIRAGLTAGLNYLCDLDGDPSDIDEFEKLKEAAERKVEETERRFNFGAVHSLLFSSERLTENEFAIFCTVRDKDDPEDQFKRRGYYVVVPSRLGWNQPLAVYTPEKFSIYKKLLKKQGAAVEETESGLNVEKQEERDVFEAAYSKQATGPMPWPLEPKHYFTRLNTLEALSDIGVDRVRTMTITGFISELAEKANVDLIINTSKERDEAREIYDGIRQSKGLPKNPHIEDMLSCAALTYPTYLLTPGMHPALGMGPGVPHSLDPVLEALGVSRDSQGRSNGTQVFAILNRDMLEDQGLWKKSIVLNTISQGIAARFNELSSDYMDNFSIANPEIIKLSLFFIYATEGPEGVKKAVRFIVERHADVLSHSLSPCVQELKDVYRLALSGELFREYGVDIAPDESVLRTTALPVDGIVDTPEGEDSGRAEAEPYNYSGASTFRTYSERYLQGYMDGYLDPLIDIDKMWEALRTGKLDRLSLFTLADRFLGTDRFPWAQKGIPEEIFPHFFHAGLEIAFADYPNEARFYPGEAAALAGIEHAPKHILRAMGDGRVYFHPYVVSQHPEPLGISGHVQAISSSSVRTLTLLDDWVSVKTHFPYQLGVFLRRMQISSIVHSTDVSRVLSETKLPELLGYLPEYGLGVEHIFPPEGVGTVYRDMSPIVRATDGLPLALFSFWNKDRRLDPDDPKNIPILIQIIKRKIDSQNPKIVEDYVIDEFFRPLLEIWAFLLIEMGMLFDAHGQNTLAVLNENLEIKRLLVRDFQATRIDRALRDGKGLWNGFTKHFLGEEETTAAESLSLIYDRAIGGVVFDPVINLLKEHFPINEDRMMAGIKSLFRELIGDHAERFMPYDLSGIKRKEGKKAVLDRATNTAPLEYADQAPKYRDRPLATPENTMKKEDQDRRRDETSTQKDEKRRGKLFFTGAAGDSDTGEEAVEIGQDIIHDAEETGCNITKAPWSEQYTLVVHSGIYKKNEYDKDRFNGGDVPGIGRLPALEDKVNIERANTGDLDNIEKHLEGKNPGKVVVQLSTKFDDPKDLARLLALAKKGVRFVHVNTLDLAAIPDKNERQLLRYDLYALMLAARQIQEKDFEEQNSTFRTLKFFLNTHYEKGDEDISYHYINALLKQDVGYILNCTLSSLPAAIWRKPQYHLVAAALISA